MKWKERIHNKSFWLSVVAFFALTGKTFGLYEVPAEFDTWVNVLLSMLTAIGVIIDPTTPGISDK
jgi:phi LC3 family holin